MIKNFFSILIFLVFVASDAPAQGCSDAGICTLPSFRPQREIIVKENKHELKAGIALGIGEQSVAAIDPFIGYNLNIKKYRLETRLSYGIRTGNGISVNGPGDVFVINSFDVTRKVSLSAGVKFPIEFNKKITAHAHLPMAYQPSLGTIDIVAGMSYRMSNLQIALGIQQPVGKLNENLFSSTSFPINSRLSEFHATRSFDRKGDVLLRVSRPISVNDRFTFSPGFLGIYHINEDRFMSVTDSYEEIEGSAGMTINASVFLDFKLKENGMLSANLGFPLLVRQTRPDGLTRSFVIGFDYTFSM